MPLTPLLEVLLPFLQALVSFLEVLLSLLEVPLSFLHTLRPIPSAASSALSAATILSPLVAGPASPLTHSEFLSVGFA